MKDKILIALCAFYLLLTSANLTLLPIFNDESIYLDWGIRSTTKPGMLYYSVNDGKPPLMIWFFGIFVHFINDPLFAGRFVSILFGLITLVGIFFLSRFLFGKRTAYVTSLLYIVTPLIFFYNRQSLMESGVAASGVWSTYFLIRSIKSHSPKNAIFSGLVTGLGFFIKTNAIIFLISTIVGTVYEAYKLKNRMIARSLLLISAGFIGGSVLLLINPIFWSTLSRNSRYGLTFSELLHFPISIWVSNLSINVLILSFVFTPFILIAALCGLYQFRKKHFLLVLLVLVPLILETLTVRQAVQRYLVSYTPLLLLPAGYVFSKLIDKNKKIGLGILLLSLIPALYLILLQIFSPATYFHTTRMIPGITDNGYVAGQLSGYGVNKLIPKIEALADRKIIILIAENAGNPENAMNIYFEKNKNIQTGYVQSEYFGDQLKNYECILEKNGKPMYFISRSSYLVGLEKYLILKEKISLPESTEYIGIYKMKDDCTRNKSLIVEPVMKL